MAILFIDANILLRFFDSSASEYRKLLDVLSKDPVRRDLFITEQVANEVRRNKLGVATRGMAEHSKKLLRPNSVTLPTHVDEEGTLKEWNDKYKALLQNHKELVKEFDTVANGLLSRISRSEDQASIILEAVFEDAKEASPEQKERAKLRKEFGNPPGKSKSDPIGDELSWEQILDEYERTKAQPLLIISDDGDFFSDFKGTTYVDSFLWSELRKQGGSAPQVSVFRKLSDGLRQYRETQGSEVPLPDDAALKRIEREEDSFSPLSSGFLHDMGTSVSEPRLTFQPTLSQIPISFQWTHPACEKCGFPFPAEEQRRCEGCHETFCPKCRNLVAVVAGDRCRDC